MLSRIDRRLSALGITENAASVKAGLSRDAIRSVRRNIANGRQRGVSTETVQKLAPALETTAEWLINGSGPESIVDARRIVPVGHEFLDNPETETLEASDEFDERENIEAAARGARGKLLPGELLERDVTGGLGGGGIASEIIVEGKLVDKVRATWRVPVDYLRTELRARESDVDIIAVDGDSMIPTLLPGDRVFVNRTQTSPSPDGLYAIHNGIGVVVKRLEVMFGSNPIRIRVKSDNPLHENYDLLAGEINVIGRVICKVTRL